MTDKTLTCRDCNTTFVFTVSEQEFYASKGFANDPSRCPECRAARKAQRGGDSYRSGGYGGGSYGRPRREMFPAVCSACGKDTQVPFQPRGDKPVYCSECFESQRATSSFGRNRGSW